MTDTKPAYDAHVFIDTNIVMHFKPLNEIKWHEVLKDNRGYAPNHVFLVITQVLLNELSSKKEDKSHRHSIRKRIKKFLDLLEKKFPDPSSGDTAWQDSDEISSNLFLRHFFNITAPTKDQLLARGDDEIIKSIFSYQDEIDTGDGTQKEKVFLALNDRPFRVRIKFASWIRPVDIPDEYHLESEQDHLEKENRALKKKLEEVKEPELFVGFKKDRANRAFYQLNPYIGDVLPPAKIIKKHLLIKERSPDDYPDKPSGIWVYKWPPFIDKLRNKKLRGFYKKYQLYHSKLKDWHEKIKKYGVFKFEIHNYGYAPASNIHLEFQFPDGIKIVDASSLPAEPVEPVSPSIRKLDFESMGWPTCSSRYPFYFDMAKINNSYSVEKNRSILIVKIDRISHFSPYHSDLVFVSFADQGLTERFSIEYHIVCDEMTEIREDGLLIHLTCPPKVSSLA